MWLRRSMVVLALIAAVEIVTLAVRGLLEDSVITPLLYFAWGVVRIFESLPQSAIWMAVVLALAAIAAGNLWGGERNPTRRDIRNVPRGRVFNWARLIGLAENHEYSRWRLAQRLALLLAETIAERERIELRAARQRLAEGDIHAPPHIAAFLRAGLDGYRQTRGFFFQRKQPSALDVNLDEVVTAVEQIVRSGR